MHYQQITPTTQNKKKRREKRAITKSLAQYIYMTGRFRCTWSEVICAPCIIRFRISTATLPYKCRFRAYLMLLAGRRKKLSSFHKRLTPQSTRRESAPVHNERRRRPRKMVSVYFKDGGVNGSFPLFALSLSRRAAILIQRYRPPPFSSPSKKKKEDEEECTTNPALTPTSLISLLHCPYSVANC